LPERRGELDAAGGGSDAATLGYCGQAPEPQGDKNVWSCRLAASPGLTAMPTGDDPAG
jgi:hypothetical protein